MLDRGGRDISIGGLGGGDGVLSFPFELLVFAGEDHDAMIFVEVDDE